MSHIELSIVIVNWNSVQYVVDCINAIRDDAVRLPYEIVVVDGASYDACQTVLARDFPDVTFVQSTENVGFGQANNLGVTHATGEVLLLLNPDTQVRRGALDRMYDSFVARREMGILGCRLLNSDGTLQTSCVQPLPTVLNQAFDADLLQQWFPTFRWWGMRALFGDRSKAAEVEAVSGACMMIRKDVFNQVGGFSPDFFMYGEDLDLCRKVRQVGLGIYHLGNAEIVHHGGGSSHQLRSTFSTVMLRESVALYLRKHRGPFVAKTYRTTLTAVALVRLAILSIAWPIWGLRRNSSWKAAFRKWLAILGWGIGVNREIVRPRAAQRPAEPEQGRNSSCAASAAD